jgi:hypothetical protein
MKYFTQILLLSLLTTGVALADIIDFSLMGNDIQNIGDHPYTLSNVTFQYAGDPAANVCGFNTPGNPGIELGIVGSTVLPCVGAQVDSGGVYGLTDGTLSLGFGQPGYSLAFGFNLLNYDGSALGQSFGVGVSFFSGLQYLETDVVSTDENDSPFYGSTFYVDMGPILFDSAVVNFFPTAPFDETLQTFGPYGQTTFQVTDMTFGEVPEPGSAGLFGLSLLAIGAVRFRKRVR